ncbi:acetyltransferase [Vibrio parahaemolyticus]|nr:acetyltransferase [Vibrio parahaemolyticus]EGR2708037.1 acetyltransferase [Vibrio parahaemolyticus]EGR3192446.1 acetyltransferase [Vibrio parahaemolyticus]EGR3207983.1 acetyltransferase [Vibrio parahaemolyticus]EGR3446068.1 acetyltransferase [Vibrio parahaemolyticus]
MINITKRLRGILNARHFWIESALMFTAQWFRLGGRRCSPLNAALVANEEKCT